MVEIDRKLLAKIHKQKRHANPNHDVHFMARELDDWLVQGLESMVGYVVGKRVATLAVSGTIEMVFTSLLGF